MTYLCLCLYVCVGLVEVGKFGELGEVWVWGDGEWGSVLATLNIVFVQSTLYNSFNVILVWAKEIFKFKRGYVLAGGI